MFLACRFIAHAVPRQLIRKNELGIKKCISSTAILLHKQGTISGLRMGIKYVCD